MVRSRRIWLTTSSTGAILRSSGYRSILSIRSASWERLMIPCCMICRRWSRLPPVSLLTRDSEIMSCPNRIEVEDRYMDGSASTRLTPAANTAMKIPISIHFLRLHICRSVPTRELCVPSSIMPPCGKFASGYDHDVAGVDVQLAGVQPRRQHIRIIEADTLTLAARILTQDSDAGGRSKLCHPASLCDHVQYSHRPLELKPAGKPHLTEDGYGVTVKLLNTDCEFLRQNLHIAPQTVHQDVPQLQWCET